mmetsp:Transcript_20426/g.48401  ORF Transcript_20426/g.48401 Transcript_20426/m.48401 type:complete len:241 (+) Transcript_20426:708-1430(+)
MRTLWLSCRSLPSTSWNLATRIARSSHSGATHRTVRLRWSRPSSTAVSPKWSPEPSVATTRTTDTAAAEGGAEGAAGMSRPSYVTPLSAALLVLVLLLLGPEASEGSYSHCTTPEVTMYTASGLLPCSKTTCWSLYRSTCMPASMASYCSMPSVCLSPPSAPRKARAIIGRICASLDRSAPPCRAPRMSASLSRSTLRASKVLFKYWSLTSLSSLSGTAVSSTGPRHVTVVSCRSESSAS